MLFSLSYGFCADKPNIWIKHTGVQTLSLACWPLSRKNIVSESVKIFVIVLLITYPSRQVSLPVTSRAGYSTGTTLIRYSSRYNERTLLFRDGRRHDRSANQSKTCSSYFYQRHHASGIRPHKVRSSFISVWGKSDRICGAPSIELFTKAIHPLTELTSVLNFSP